MQIKILVNGAHGQLGQELMDIAEMYPDFSFKFYAKSEWDITSETESERILRLEKPHFLIHAAAYTKVDLAESNPELCFLLNAYAPQMIAELCNSLRIHMIYLSSDYVFFQNENKLIQEDKPKNPVGIYAQSKSLGEDLVLKSNAESLVIRTSWLYSSFGHNFVKTMLHLSKTLKSVKVVQDQIGSPTYARHLAHALIQIITQTAGQSLMRNERVFHYSNKGVCSWLDLADEIFTYCNIKVDLLKISTEEFGAAAPRPAFSGLDCTRVQQQFGLTIAPWKEALHACLDKLLPNLYEKSHENK